MSDNQNLFGGSDDGLSPWVEFTYQGYTYAMKRRYAEELDATVEQVLIDAEEDSENTPTGESFCGCAVCILRETIAVTIAYAVDGLERGLVKKSKGARP